MKGKSAMRILAVGLVLVAILLPLKADAFSWVESILDGDIQGGKTVDGLSFSWAVAVSPDGGHVYVCSGVSNSGNDDAVAVFSRDGATGRLTYVESLFDDGDLNNPGAADGLLSCRGVTVSPDGRHVYTAGSSDSKVGIFSRNAATGRLTFLSAVQDGGGVDGLAGLRDIVVSPDGKAVFVAGTAEDALAAFSRDAATGALMFEDFEKNGLGGVTGLDRPLQVSVSPDGKHVYAASGSNANFSGSDAIALFAWDPGVGPGDGSLTFVESYFEGAIQGGNVIDGLSQVTDVTVSPDGKHVYAVSEVDTLTDGNGNGNDWIAIFSRNSATGKLTWLDAVAGFRVCGSLFGADAASFVVVSPDGRQVYVTKNWADNGVAQFARNAGTGALTFNGAVCDFDPDDIGMNLPRRMAPDPGGEHLYVAGNAANSVVTLLTPSSALPDVTVNGSDGPIVINRGDPLSVRVALSAGELKGKPGDWWVVVRTPFPGNLAWYHFDLAQGWIPGLKPTFQGPVGDLKSKEVLRTRLPAGSYRFYFGVDTVVDGVPTVKALHFDEEKVTVSP